VLKYVWGTSKNSSKAVRFLVKWSHETDRII
jgi:hypothetical protein